MTLYYVVVLWGRGLGADAVGTRCNPERGSIRRRDFCWDSQQYQCQPAGQGTHYWNDSSGKYGWGGFIINIWRNRRGDLTTDRHGQGQKAVEANISGFLLLIESCCSSAGFVHPPTRRAAEKEQNKKKNLKKRAVLHKTADWRPCDKLRVMSTYSIVNWNANITRLQIQLSVKRLLFVQHQPSVQNPFRSVWKRSRYWWRISRYAIG